VQKIEKFNINITKAMHGEVLPPRYACSSVGSLLKKEKKLGRVLWLATFRG
jgi:hypothetical protein